MNVIPLDRLVLESVFAKLGELKFLVVGDLMLDEYLWGKAERLSPEAPVQVIDVLNSEVRLGGGGNVLNNLLALGCRVAVAGVVGDDDDGRLLCEQVAALGVACDGIFCEAGRKTSRKTRVVASRQQVLRIDRESREPIGTAAEERLIAYLRAKVAEFDAILVSDYLKGVLTPAVLAAVIAAGRAADIPVLVDPKGEDYRRYRGATLLTPNRREAQLATKIAIGDEESLQSAGRTLCHELELAALLITRSEEGMSLFFSDGTHHHLPTVAREVFDVSGAGDTVLALMGVGLAMKLDYREAASLANLAAGVVVGKVGTSTVTPDELLRAVGERHADSDLKILSRERLARIVGEAQARGKTVVFTNGCFDLLHVGHVKYLQQARRLGDLLVLGLNSDASIRRLKGEKRPLIGEEERAHILAALDCIDHVVVFDEDTPLELIKAIKPRVLVKGGDYTPETVVGRAEVESWGGRVELITFVDGHSTTRTIDRILEHYRDV